MINQTLIALSSSPTLGYAFLSPITTLFWRDVIGHIPRIYLVGNERQWTEDPKLNVIRNAFKYHKLDQRFVEKLDGYSEATFAQSLRQHVAASLDWTDVVNDIWVMPSDIDLWPLRREFYYQHYGAGSVAGETNGSVESSFEVDEPKAVLYYANGDHWQGRDEMNRRISAGLAYQSIPTCHVTCRVSTWREMYGYESDDVRAETKRTLDNWLKPKTVGGDKNGDVWMADQRIVTEMLANQPWFPDTRLDGHNRDDVVREGKVVFITRQGHGPVTRLDRGCSNDWKIRPYQKGRWIDAHLYNDEGYREDRWNDLLPIIESHMPQHLEWAKSYRDEFVKMF